MRIFIYPQSVIRCLLKDIILKEGFVVEAIVSIVPMGSIPKWINNFGTVFEQLKETIMKSIYILFFWILFSCSSVSVFTDHDSKVDFSKYKTYAYFKPGIDKVEISDLDKRRILKAIDFQLLGKSMMKSEVPDLLISINTTANERVYIDNMNYGFWGWNPWFWGPNFNSISSRTEGILYIDLIDAKTKQLVWQGKGKGGISEYMKNRDERIGTFVAEILQNYPPQVEM